MAVNAFEECAELRQLDIISHALARAKREFVASHRATHRVNVPPNFAAEHLLLCGLCPVLAYVREKIQMPTRDDAWKLLCEYTQSESLRKHALAVEACVRAYARKHGANEDLWGLAGLLHDFDYEKWPNAEHHPTREHPYEGSKILRERGYPDEIIQAILAHANYSGVSRVSPLDHALFACDELSGFLTACALIKPSKSMHEVETASVKKKLKDKAFARGVNREDVYKGAEELGLPLEEHIAFCIEAMRAIAPELGLAGLAARQSSGS